MPPEGYTCRLGIGGRLAIAYSIFSLRNSDAMNGISYSIYATSIKYYNLFSVKCKDN